MYEMENLAPARLLLAKNSVLEKSWLLQKIKVPLS